MVWLCLFLSVLISQVQGQGMSRVFSFRVGSDSEAVSFAERGGGGLYRLENLPNSMQQWLTRRVEGLADTFDPS